MICVNSLTPKVILLLTPVDIGKESAAPIYLKALTSTTSSIRVVTNRLPQGGYLEYRPGANRLFRALTSLISRLGAWQTFKLALYERQQLNLDTQQAQQSLQKHSAESCWITLSSAECILLAHTLLKSNVKLRVTVLDSPEYLLSSKKISQKAIERMMCLFAEVLQGAVSVSVISTNMQERYRAQYKVEATVIRPVASIPTDHQKTARRRRTLRLVFAGSLYAKTEWNALVKALSTRQWCIGDQRVVIYFLGAFPLRGVAHDRHVKQLGHRTASEAEAISKKCDVAYLPYWLSAKSNLVATTSFPSKLAAYASSGLPILNHGPQASEVTRIMRDHPIGVSCHSLVADDIMTALETLAKQTNLVAAQQAIRNLVLCELSATVVGQRFVEFMAKQKSTQ